MKRPKELTAWDFPDTHMEPDGYDMKTVIDLTPRNFDLLMEKHNHLVEVVGRLCEQNNAFVFED